MPIAIILSLIFMVLKLTNFIDWPWILVVLPVITQFIFAVILLTWKEIDPVGYYRFWNS